MNLYHFSEEPAITCFEPRPPTEFPGAPAVVWAIGEAHAPHYWLPRDCPRVIGWVTDDTTPDDIARFFGHGTARKIIAIESGWLPRVRATRLYAYRLPTATFALFDRQAGYWVSRVAVAPLASEPLDELPERIVAAGIELRVTPSLWPLRDALSASSLGFSIIRMRNARPRETA